MARKLLVVNGSTKSSIRLMETLSVTRKGWLRATGLLPFTNFATEGAGKARDSTGMRLLTQALSRGWLAHKLMLEQGGVGLFI